MERDRRRPSTTNTNAIPVTSTGASMFAGSSTPNVTGGMFNNSQGDQIMSTFNNCTLYVGSDTMGSSLAASLNKLQMDSEKHSTNPHLTADTTSTSGMDSVEASALLGTSSPSVLVRGDSHLQRGPNKTDSGDQILTLCLLPWTQTLSSLHLQSCRGLLILAVSSTIISCF